ncbi:hypothetical protein L1987_77300 [Smallanthus sonchifolius]|uniref:Uncharacterized protein n=1 Tax=Smallanthus sonchifolius TaxID=185202 RepID=A0ACB8ZA16_9ASTR|nr:hypothetical protein L1987_77300 [Smallanthus sonchifolius]
MYGDCEVMSNIGGENGIFPEFNFMSFTDFSSIIPKEEMKSMVRLGKEEMESGSGSDQIEGGLSGNELETDQQQPPAKKKRYHRHTAHQIQEMEAYVLFKESPHPDDKRRMKLSQELGLKPRQVKFWFQNRRTQMKAQQDRSHNAILRTDNENLRNENSRLQNALRALVCSKCEGSPLSFDEQQLRMENARLKEELDHACLIATQFCGSNPMQTQGQCHSPPMMPSNLDFDMNIPIHMIKMPCSNEMMQINPLMAPEAPNSDVANGLIIMDDEKPLAMQYAVSYMDEVDKMCRLGEPLWTQVNDVGKEVLNLDEYVKMFPCTNSRKNDPNLRYEASRTSSIVIINSINLVDAFLDAVCHLCMLNCKCHPHLYQQEKFTSFVTALETPTMEVDGSWTIVDFPLDSFHETYESCFTRYKRLPSGCIIQDMPNGYSRVTWVEHGEAENDPVHRIFTDYVSSGMAFGARRWLAVLQRQCERLTSLMARNVSANVGVVRSLEARTNMMNVAQRMASLTAVSTTWLPHPHYQVFDLLRDERRRSQLDIISNGNQLREVDHIANGSHPGNSISLLRVNVASNSSRDVELVLQESCTDDSGSLVVYSPVDVDAVKLTMNDRFDSQNQLIKKMALVKELMKAFHFACTFSFWRMVFLWTFPLIVSYIKLHTQSIFPHKKSTYPRCAVSPLPPMTSSSATYKTFGRRLPICIITGATSGLGAAAALALSKEGFFVVLAGRSSHKLSKVIFDIRRQNKEAHLEGFEVDLSSFSSIMIFKKSLEKWLLDSDMHPSVQLLINNAGILSTTSRLTTEGHDRMMGTNYIGAFSLTEVLLPLLKNSPIPSRIVNVSSFTHRNASSFRPDRGTVSGKSFSEFKNYPCAEIYEHSKLCLLLFSYELHRQLHLTEGSQTISVMAVDPGAVKTEIMREVPWFISQAAFVSLRFLGLLQSPKAGVSSILDAALAPPETSGLYFFGGNGRTVDSSALSYNLKLSRELWATSCDIFQDSLLIYNRVSVCSEKVD